MTEILIHEEITAPLARRVIDELRAAAGEEVLLRIHSPGGSVFDGAAIAGAMREHGGRITARIDGVALSMAANLALEAAEIEMHHDGWLMFHEARATAAGGTAAELRSTGDILEKINASTVRALSAVLGESTEEVARMLAEEIWMNGEEAEGLGIAARLLSSPAIAAHFDLSEFSAVPTDLSDENDLRNCVDPAPETVTKGANLQSDGEQICFFSARPRRFRRLGI